MKNIFEFQRKKLFLAIIMIILAVVLIIYTFYYFPKKNESIKVNDYHDLISNNHDREGSYVEINFNYLTIIASENKYNYFLVKDTNNYTYIIKIGNETYNDILSIYENSEEFQYKISGYLSNISDDLRKMTIKTFNNNFNKEITIDNFEEYFGSTYLNESYHPINYQNVIYIIIIILGLLIISIGLFLIIYCIIDYKKKKRLLKKYNKSSIIRSFKMEDTYLKEKVALLNRYIILNKGFLKIIPYLSINKIYIQDNYLCLEIKNDTKIIKIKSKKHLIEIENKIKEKVNK